MLWGNKQISAFEQNKYKGSKCVMGMNESVFSFSVLRLTTPFLTNPRFPSPSHPFPSCPLSTRSFTASVSSARDHQSLALTLTIIRVNVKSQGYLSVSDGIKLWNTYVRPLKAQGYLTVSPSVTAGPDGVTWLQQFYKNCGGNNHCGVCPCFSRLSFLLLQR